MEFIDILLNIMKERNISGYQLEKDIGIKQSTFGQWKKRGSLPTIDKLILLANYFKVSTDELLGIQHISVPSKPTDKLSENEAELIEQFRKLPEREQIKFIGRLEEAAKNLTQERTRPESSNSKIG